MNSTSPVSPISPSRRTSRVVTAVAALLALLLGLVLALGGSQLTPTRAAAAELATTASATTASGQHPFGDPVWFPLRKPSSIGCANKSCGAYTSHNYWAIDWTGLKGDPVHAAGAGILHIGGRASGCSPADGSGERSGNWVWIDHGAGVVSRYSHLDSIVAKEGQLVTPATQIGTMGSTGDNEPCTINYLHFEVRHGGVKGTRVDFGQLFACTDQGLRRLPAELGAQSWDDPAIHTRPRKRTPQVDDACMSATWLRTPARPQIGAKAGSRSVTVSWPRPAADVTAVVIAVETYKPSLKRYAGAVYTAVSPRTTSRKLTGLDNGRAYRISVHLRNDHGVSRASASRTVKPAAAPDAPKAARYATWTKRDYVHYGWYRPYHNGSHVTSFTVAARCGAKGTGFSAWRTYKLSDRDAYYNVRGMAAKKYTVCEVKVRAGNDVGQGAWSKTTKVRWQG